MQIVAIFEPEEYPKVKGQRKPKPPGSPAGRKEGCPAEEGRRKPLENPAGREECPTVEGQRKPLVNPAGREEGPIVEGPRTLPEDPVGKEVKVDEGPTTEGPRKPPEEPAGREGTTVPRKPPEEPAGREETMSPKLKYSEEDVEAKVGKEPSLKIAPSPLLDCPPLTLGGEETSPDTDPAPPRGAYGGNSKLVEDLA